MKTHTAPNQCNVQIVLGKGSHPMHVCVARRNGVAMAMYPAQWTQNRIPSINELQRDARWQIAKA